jgi:5-formyltetrahydrofolate cyclo-ligase
MEARTIKDLSELSESSYHLREPLSSVCVIPPEALDFIIVPALTFDSAGYRLGRGGGYYDRYLLKTNAFTAGIARERLICEAVPREAHDVPVRCVVTEKKARLHKRSLA